jgi:hypothetical protein
MPPVVVQKQYRDDGPVQVDELQGDNRVSISSNASRARGDEAAKRGASASEGWGEVRVFSYPVVGEDEAEEPEEDVDVEEEESVGEDERVRGAPGGDRPGVIRPSTHEGEVEEDGGERDEGRDDQVLEAAASHGSGSELLCSALCFGWSGEHGAVGFIAREDLRRAGWEIVAVKKKAKKRKKLLLMMMKLGMKSRVDNDGFSSPKQDHTYIAEKNKGRRTDQLGACYVLYESADH